jgi:hypothetical protein
MEQKAEIPRRESVIEELEARQRNTVWPDTMVNGRSVDEFLWKGSPDAPLVQRMGAWIIGLFFILMGLLFFDIAYEKHDRVFGVFSIPWIFLGIKVFLNGCRRRKAARPESK